MNMKVIVPKVREMLNKSTVYGEPAQLCDAGIDKIRGLAPLILPKKFPHLFNWRYLQQIGAATLITAASLLSMSTASAVTVTAENFQQAESPWDMAFLPDGTMFFTEKCRGLSVRLPSGGEKHCLACLARPVIRW